MDLNDLLLTAVRATLVYFFLLFVIRVLGKRSVGAISAFDLVVALMLGEVVDEIIFGDVSLVKGLLAISVIALWEFVNEWSSFKSKLIRRWTEGEPAVFVKNGKIQHAALAKERFSEAELFSQLRMQSVDEDELEEVKQATLETSGHVSVLKREEAKPLQKSDLAEPKVNGKSKKKQTA
jgi:uncharacterized membrane protein YcaP (DUF421 family)